MIPSELSSHDKRFKMSHLDGGKGRIPNLLGPFIWLKDANIINPCFNVNEPTVIPSLTIKGDDFKAYFLDTGLLYSLTFPKVNNNELFYKSIIIDKLHINEGMFAENYVSQALFNNGNKLYFYVKRNQTTYKTEMEIDFLMLINNKITPIEVKSGELINIKSLKKFKEKFPFSSDGIVLYEGDIKTIDNVIYLPIFVASLL